MIGQAAEVLPEAPLEAEKKHRRVFALPGGEVLVREAGREDAERLRRMFSRCSQETIYSRFHLPLPTVPEWAIGVLANGGEAIVAVGGDGEVAGHAMYVRDERDGREAEVAVVVEDERRSSGLGMLLLSIARAARRTGVEELTGSTLGDNYRLHGVVRRVFPDSHISYAGGSCSIRVPLGTLTAEEGATG